MKIQLHYTLTPDDFYEVQAVYRRNRRSLTPKRPVSLGLRMLVGFGLIAFIVVGVIVDVAFPSRRPAPADDHGIFMSLLPYAVVILIALALYWRGRSRLIHRQLAGQFAKIGEPQAAEILESSVKIQLPGCASVMEWTYFIRFVETESTFLLFTLPRVAQILPKRAFASGGELDEFRAFAQAHIGNQPIGFPVQPVKAAEVRGTPLA